MWERGGKKGRRNGAGGKRGGRGGLQEQREIIRLEKERGWGEAYCCDKSCCRFMTRARSDLASAGSFAALGNSPSHHAAVLRSGSSSPSTSLARFGGGEGADVDDRWTVHWRALLLRLHYSRRRWVPGRQGICTRRSRAKTSVRAGKMLREGCGKAGNTAKKKILPTGNSVKVDDELVIKH